MDDQVRIDVSSAPVQRALEEAAAANEERLFGQSNSIGKGKGVVAITIGIVLLLVTATLFILIYASAASTPKDLRPTEFVRFENEPQLSFICQDTAENCKSQMDHWQNQRGWLPTGPMKLSPPLSSVPDTNKVRAVGSNIPPAEESARATLVPDEWGSPAPFGSFGPRGVDRLQHTSTPSTMRIGNPTARIAPLIEPETGKILFKESDRGYAGGGAGGNRDHWSGHVSGGRSGQNWDVHGRVDVSGGRDQTRDTRATIEGEYRF